MPLEDLNKECNIFNAISMLRLIKRNVNKKYRGKKTQYNPLALEKKLNI